MSRTSVERAQGGIDVVQILPELTNADAAIAASDRKHGRDEPAEGVASRSRVTVRWW